MFITEDYDRQTASAGAALDIKNVGAGEVMMVGSGVIGAGVLGTSLLIGAYSAPLPILGGTALALGLGIGAGFVDDDINATIESAMNRDKKAEAKPAEAAVTDREGKTVDVEGL